jgi:DNA-directed RNA polymerase specialized sigma24 family protein
MHEEPPGSVTHWIGHLRRGDADAAQALWERYFGRLVRLTRKRLRGAVRPASDEEDVALCAFDSVFRGIEGGRFPQLANRDDLWGLLVVVAARKAVNQAKHDRRLKRGGGRVVAEADLAGGAADEDSDLDRFLGREPTPEFAALVAEESRRLLDQLGDDTLRRIALWRMEGLTNEEVAARLDCSLRTVANKLQLIRLKWEQA